MRKLIITGMAVAMLAVPAAASATVPAAPASEFISTTEVRDALNVGKVGTDKLDVIEMQKLIASKTAKFTVNQPKDSTGQFTNVWRHEFSVAVKADGSFTGTGSTFDNWVQTPTWTEEITGKFNADNTVSFKTVPNAGATFEVKNAPYGESVVAESPYAGVVEMKPSKPVYTDGVKFTTHYRMDSIARWTCSDGSTQQWTSRVIQDRDLLVTAKKLFGVTLGWNVGSIDENVGGRYVRGERIGYDKMYQCPNGSSFTGIAPHKFENTVIGAIKVNGVDLPAMNRFEKLAAAIKAYVLAHQNA
jgi:hypothetical protein